MAFLKKKSDVIEVVKDGSKQEASDKPNAKEKAYSLFAWIYQPIVVIIAMSAIVVAVQELLVFKQIETQQQSSTNALIVSSLKQRVDHHITAQSASLSAMAEGLNAVSSEDIQKALGTQKLAHSDIDATYLIGRHQNALLADHFPALSFASIDLIRRTFKGDAHSAEAFFNEGSWFYQLAAKVNANQVVLVIYNTQGLLPLMRLASDGTTGKASLTKGNKEIVSLGKGEDQLAVSLPTKIPQWKVQYAPTKASLNPLDSSIVWAIHGIAAVLVALLTYFLARARISLIQRDLQLAAKHLKSSLAGENRKAKAQIHYAEIQSLVSLVSGAAQEMKKRLENAVNAEPAARASRQPNVEPDDAPLFDDDLLDIDLLAEVDETENIPHETNETLVQELEDLTVDVPQSIFRAYDIRGIVDETLNENVVELIGQALATEAIAQGQSKLCVGYDGRLSSVSYCNAITKGITSTGIDAVIIGQVPTPVLYFATHHLETGSGVMITGSHNPGNYNGFKMMLAGKTLSGDDIQKLYNRITMQDFASGEGTVVEQSVDRAYLDHILDDVAIAAPLKVVVDAGNGVAGELAPLLIEELGCEVIPLFCNIDGSFPNHHPDPGKPENLKDLIEAVKANGADLGLAFDGDGDRVGVVTNTGKIIWPDRLLMLFAKDVVSRNPGADVIYDVKCSRRLNGLISSYGGRPIMWKTGHSLIKAKMKETGALLAGEMSGHIFFKERWFGFDDGLYSAVRLLEILGIEDQSSDAVFEAFPEDISTPEINITVTDESKFQIIQKLCMLKSSFTGGNVSTIDGLRVDYPNGWGLCRASNTTPMLVLRFEADDEAALEEIKSNFKTQLAAVDSSLNLNF